MFINRSMSKNEENKKGRDTSRPLLNIKLSDYKNRNDFPG